MSSAPRRFPAGRAARHGNPTVELHDPVPAGGWHIAVAPPEQLPVWISHGLPGGTEAVRVDVRDGRFCGAGAGWSVLPPGEYLAHLVRAGVAPVSDDDAVAWL